MTNRDKLRSLLTDIFLLDGSEFRFDLAREEVETWDSLAVVSLAVGIQETFGYHCTPPEAMGLRGFGDIMALLSAKGISFHDA